MKEKISNEVEMHIRDNCTSTTKGRTVAGDNFEMKRYLKEVPVETASEILKTRLHMRRIGGNFGIKKCGLCKVENASTEHYLTCSGTLLLREYWGVTREATLETQDIDLMVKVSKFLADVERKWVH